MSLTYLHPGVYVQEIASGVRPIEGVSTSTGVSVQELAHNAHPIDGVPTPGWTDHNAGDPGVTLFQLFAFLGESLTYRANQVPEREPGPPRRLTEQARESDASKLFGRKP